MLGLNVSFTHFKCLPGIISGEQREVFMWSPGVITELWWAGQLGMALRKNIKKALMLDHCNDYRNVFGSTFLQSFVIFYQDIFTSPGSSLSPHPRSLSCYSVLFWYCQSANVCINLFINTDAKAKGLCLQFNKRCTIRFPTCLPGT